MTLLVILLLVASVAALVSMLAAGGQIRSKLRALKEREKIEEYLVEERDLNRRAELRLLLRQVVPDPLWWLEAPNPSFGLKCPAEVIAEGNGEWVVDALNRVKFGAFS